MYRKRILQTYIILKLKSENYFLTDEFNERLVRHRKNIYKRKLTIIAMDDFLNQYDMLSDDLKEREQLEYCLYYRRLNILKTMASDLMIVKIKLLLKYADWKFCLHNTW